MFKRLLAHKATPNQPVDNVNEFNCFNELSAYFTSLPNRPKQEYSISVTSVFFAKTIFRKSEVALSQPIHVNLRKVKKLKVEIKTKQEALIIRFLRLFKDIKIYEINYMKVIFLPFKILTKTLILANVKIIKLLIKSKLNNFNLSWLLKSFNSLAVLCLRLERFPLNLFISNYSSENFSKSSKRKKKKSRNTKIALSLKPMDLMYAEENFIKCMCLINKNLNITDFGDFKLKSTYRQRGDKIRLSFYYFKNYITRVCGKKGFLFLDNLEYIIYSDVYEGNQFIEKYRENFLIDQEPDSEDEEYSHVQKSMTLYHEDRMLNMKGKYQF